MSDDKTKEEKIKAVIEEIRPSIQMDGGDIEFVSLDGNTVNVRLRGACCGCPGARMTLKMGVEERLREVIPEIEAVEAV